MPTTTYAVVKIIDRINRRNILDDITLCPFVCPTNYDSSMLCNGNKNNIFHDDPTLRLYIYILVDAQHTYRFFMYLPKYEINGKNFYLQLVIHLREHFSLFMPSCIIINRDTRVNCDLARVIFSWLHQGSRLKNVLLY